MKKLNWLFWSLYVLVGIACWTSTFQVFKQSDSPFVAAIAATAVEGVLALTLFILGKSSGSLQATAIIGTVAFALISLVAQTIQRFTGLGVEMPYELKMASLFLLPASTTLSLVLLGVLKLFDRDGNGIPDFMEKNKNKQNRPQVQQSHQSSHQQEPRTISVDGVPLSQMAHTNGNGVREFSTEMPSIGELRRMDGQPFPTKPRS